jgi:hypothetical protein
LEDFIERDIGKPVDQFIRYLVWFRHDLTNTRGWQHRWAGRLSEFPVVHHGSFASHTWATDMAFNSPRVIVQVAASAERDPEENLDLLWYCSHVTTVLSTQMQQQSPPAGQKIRFGWVLVTERADVEHISVVVFLIFQTR